MPSTHRPHNRPQNRVARFFLWCAGSDTRVLEEVPRSESIKQIGYGTLVVVPAVLALFAMSYALSTLTESPAVYIGGGLVWALIVFCFDRFIVSTFRKSRSAVDDLTSTVFISRVIFAAFVGVIVAHPLVMLYFNDTIEERLDRDGQRKVEAIEASFAQKRSEVESRIATLKSEIRDRERERNDFQSRLVDEIDGVVSGRTTGIPGRGASAEEKKLQLQIAQQELEAARDRNLVEIAALQQRLVDLGRESREQRASFEQPRDYLARAGALAALAAEHPHVDRVKFFLILFFVFVDTLPILFKGFTPRGPYDDLLQLGELKSERSVQAERDSLERVLYPYMVMSRETSYVAEQSYKGVHDYAQRYRDFLDELSRHQEEFLGEWRRQQEVLTQLEDEDLRRTQLAFMESLRTSSAEVVNKAVDRFGDSLLWESRQTELEVDAT
jgi:hypothetical protein